MAISRETGLQRDAVGLMSVLFMSVTNMAPGAAVAFSILFAAPYAGGSTPLAVLLGLLVPMLVAISIGQLAKHLPSAGGLSTYNAHGLGAATGFLVGWGFILAEVIVAPGGFLILGNVISGVLHTSLGWPTWTWAPFGVVAAVVTWFLVYRGIRLSTSAGVILGAFELLVFLALAVTLIVAAGHANTLSVFAPHTGNAKGWGSVIPGRALCRVRDHRIRGGRAAGGGGARPEADGAARRGPVLPRDRGVLPGLLLRRHRLPGPAPHDRVPGVQLR